ncbi:lytic transglycosylase [Pseudomonas sp. A25(2017)]|uniref:lytic transglycosylase domain-containing protein n=1 Tax=Pseudomonas sp. A25(2017) TaxID=1945865 RepID=UPI0009861B82|nr:lytic transglycosylase domain-containing protein [Pseudomonas sp. A25(2017)]OOG83233.1 lytic transglycosylase [Pseudomonas sp. A25(2017)]
MLTASAVMTLALQCAPAVHPQTTITIVKTESGFNPWAIGVVGKVLPQQPQTLEEAVVKVKELVAEGANFSIGLGQINRYNFDVNKSELVFDPCTNLRMAAANLEACYERVGSKGDTPQEKTLKAISCYYSGNETTGFRAEPQFGGTSHVQRIVANAESYKVGPITAEGSNPAQPLAQPPVPQPIPTYESWDVLRQYPRYAPVPAPDRKPVPTPEEVPQENNDV